jgi:ABC-type multidrug transport system ATPase subunit
LREIKYFGKNISQLDLEPRHYIGYVGQDSDRSAYARLTVKENLMFFGCLQGLDKRHVLRSIHKYSDLFDFDDQINQCFMFLSGGQKQTAIIMRALLHSPPIIFLDEPTKGLDPIISKKIRHFLGRFAKEEKKTILLTSHIMTEVEELSDKLAFIYNGTITEPRPPSEIQSSLAIKDYLEIKNNCLTEALTKKILCLPRVHNAIEREYNWTSFGLSHFSEGVTSVMELMKNENVEPEHKYYRVTLEDAFLAEFGDV